MVTRLIAHDNVSSQPHLQELLKAQGIEATQATISRDLEELGAVKIRIAGETRSMQLQNMHQLELLHLINCVASWPNGLLK